MLLPVACAACDRVGHGPVCPRCVAALEPPPDLSPPAGVDAVVALCAYTGAGRALAAGLKFGNGRRAAAPLGTALGRAVSAAGAGPVDAVTWAPTTVERRRRRGFDQSRLLAGAVGRQLGVPVLGLLVREGRSPQTGRGRADRLVGVSFRARRASPPVVLVVDDVRTTGATLGAAARALRGAGALVVVGATVAATPP